MTRVPEASEADAAWVILPTRTVSPRGRRRLAPAKQKRGRGEHEQIGNVHPGDDIEVARELVKLHFEITKLRRRIDNKIAAIDFPDATPPPVFDGTGVPVWIDGLLYQDMPGLYAWYRLGEAAASTTYEDSSDNGYDLTLTGTGTAIGTGDGNEDVMGDLDDGAVDFSGAATTLSGGTRPKYLKSGSVYDAAYNRASPRLMMAWVNPDVAFTNNPVAASPTDNNFFPILAITNGEVGANGVNNEHAVLGWNSLTKKLTFLHSDTTDVGGMLISSTSYPASTGTVERDEWTHVAWYFDPDTDQSFLFIDGEQDSVHADTASSANGSGTACWLEIGSTQWAHGALASGFGYDLYRNWQGLIDEAVICYGEQFDETDIYNFAFVNGADGGSWVIIPVVDAIPAGAIDEDKLSFDVATQAELDAHINDTTDAHDASAISVLDAANDFTATNVETVLAELQSDHETDEAALAAHLADTVDAHDASAVSIADAGGYYTGTEVEAALQELGVAAVGGLAAHLADTSDAHDASAISYVGGPGMSATDVEAAVDELATEKADLASPALTGNPTAPTPAGGDNDTSIATTAYVQGELASYTTTAGLTTLLAAKAPLASPVFTGNPTAPTPSAADNDTSIATTAFVQGELTTHVGATGAHAATKISYAGNAGLSATTVEAALDELDDEKAPLASPALTGNPTAPTATVGDNDTSIATTAFVTAAVAAGGGGGDPALTFFLGV